MRSLIVGMSFAVVAATVHAVSYTWPADTSGGLRFENNVYTVDTTPGTLVNNGTMTVTNATVNAWTQSNNTAAFENESTVNLESNGVFKVYSFKPDGILNLNRGSVLELEKFVRSQNASGRINADGGKIVFRNVSNPSTYNWFENYQGQASGWCINVKEGGLVVSNAVSGAPRGHMPPAKSGAANDGGVTYEGAGTIYVNANNHTFNGGVRFNGGLTLAPNSDAVFGAVPATPNDNIFFLKSATIYGNATDLEINRNRSIVLSPGVRMTGGSATSLRVLGTITGDLSTSVQASSGWNGSLVLSPGEGRTNRVGRLQATGRLVVESGTTVVTTNSAASTDPAYSVVGIEGNNSAYSDYKGVFEAKGGELRSEGSGYVPIRKYGQLVVSGGVCDFRVGSQEILNGFGSAGRTIVKNSGELRCYTFRLTQCSTGNGGGEIPTQLWLGTNGVVKCRSFTVGGSTLACRVDFDGGVMKGDGNGNVGNFLGKSNEEWPYVPVYVHEGGAAFDSNGNDIGVYLPLQSAAASDGGLTKKGDGTLTVGGANTYNGPTRVLGGTIAFTNASGFPGGDVEIDGEMLAARSTSTACITVPSLAFNSGSKIRILVSTGFNLSRLKSWHKVVSSTATIAGDVPEVEVVDAVTGETVSCIAKATLDDGGKSISVKASDKGFCLIYR